MYEVTVDDMICAFVQIANYKLWLRGGSTGKGPDFASFKLNTTVRCGDRKLLADAMKSYPGVENLNIGDCALEGLELFESTKRKHDLPQGVDCDSHRPDKVNYLIPRHNTRVRKACIEEYLNFAEHGVAHTTSVLKTDCFFFPLAYCMIATQLCQKMLGNASQYMDFVQCQSQNWQTWHTSSHVQGRQHATLHMP